MKLDGKKAVVTGAGRGIGKAIAIKLASLGADVAIVDIDAETAGSTAAEIASTGATAVGYELDITDAEAVATVFKGILEDLGGLDILVNNAGLTRDNLLLRMSPDDWDLVMRVNLKGAFNCTRAAVRPMMSQRSGRIISIASVVGLVGNAGQANYAASKAGLIALMKTVAREFGGRNITANAVAPGFIETPMTESLPEKAREDFASRIVLKRFGSPSDVANLVAFLASDEADYITGQTINIDGGML
ncbi:MAG: 3-oxoacyl-[acyl-carrier-protein] reductase [Candidatus Eisenbacteria sp.]|nr:3-oxoacyl-[acyl-carrier-protein] reductase [Candidatus Eisenbacteria bacterium]